MNLSQSNNLSSSKANDVGLELLPDAPKKRSLGDPITVSCPHGGSAQCSLGDNECVPYGSVCPHRPLLSPKDNPEGCKKLQHFLDSNTELLSSCRRAYADMVHAKGSYDEHYKALQDIQNTDPRTVSQETIDLLLGELRNQFMIYNDSRTGLERELRLLLLDAAENDFYDLTGDPDTMSLFLKQLVADGSYLLSFSNCSPSCGEHGTCKGTYPYDPSVNSVSCDIGCAGSEYKCDNSPKGVCECSDGYTGDVCQIAPQSAVNE